MRVNEHANANGAVCTSVLAHINELCLCAKEKWKCETELKPNASQRQKTKTFNENFENVENHLSSYFGSSKYLIECVFLSVSSGEIQMNAMNDENVSLKIRRMNNNNKQACAHKHKHTHNHSIVRRTSKYCSLCIHLNAQTHSQQYISEGENKNWNSYNYTQN